MIADVTLLVQIAATLVMCGIIWFVQIVHYPLFRLVGSNTFVTYENEHARRTTWIVAPIMVTELLTALILAWMPPAGVPQELAILGVPLVALAWLSTAMLQVPRHRQLQLRFDLSAHQALVKTNWLRTVAWTLRAVVLIAMLALRIGSSP